MKNIKVAITGGIGSGKSTVSNLIKEMGGKVYSCDAICGEIYKSQSFLRKLKKLFPTAIKGKIILKADKKEISRLTFDCKENNDKLKALLHPTIMKKLLRILNSKRGVVFAEVPLLFEGGFASLFEKVIVVQRGLQERYDSLKARSNLEREEVDKIIASQVDYDSLDLSKYIVILNDGSIENLRERVKMIIDKI